MVPERISVSRLFVMFVQVARILRFLLDAQGTTLFEEIRIR